MNSTEAKAPKETAAGDSLEPDVICRSCGYSGNINSYAPCMSAYSDCRCPTCGSTDNEHNDKWLAAIQKAWKADNAPDQPRLADRDNPMKP